MKPIIKTEEENKVALAFVERLMDGDPEPESKEGKLLSMLADEIQVFEKRYTSTPTTPSSGEKCKHEYLLPSIINPWQCKTCGEFMSPTTNGEGENKIITTIEQDRERCRRCHMLLKDCPKTRWTKPLCIVDGVEWDEHVIGISHLSLSIEHVLESLKEEVGGMRKEKVTANFYANGGIRWNQGFNKAISSVSTLIDEVIKHVKK